MRQFLQQQSQIQDSPRGRARPKALFHFAIISIMLPASVGLLAQQTSLQQITQVEREALQQGVETQQRVESLDDERTVLANDYRNTLKNLSNIKTYNQQLRDTIQQQDDQTELLNDQIERIGSLEQDIVPLMVDMLDALEKFIALDVPFLLKERQNGVRNLRELMSDPDLANSEKYRRILEAYQIENDYGRTIETYERKLNGEENAQSVNYIKIGRLAYFYQTLDGRQTFRWSKIKQTWERLAGSDNRAVQTAIAMANERIPSDLLLVPIEIPANNRQISARGAL